MCEADSCLVSAPPLIVHTSMRTQNSERIVGKSIVRAMPGKKIEATGSISRKRWEKDVAAGESATNEPLMRQT